MVGTEVLVILLLCAFLLLLIAVSSWYRKRKLAAKEDFTTLSRIHETMINGQRTFRIATVTRGDGQLNLEVYEVRLPRAEDSTGLPTIRILPPPLPPRTRNSQNPPSSPPPSFSAAVNMPCPSLIEDSPAPPRYDEVMPVSTISGAKILQDNNNCIVTVDSNSSTIISS